MRWTKLWLLVSGVVVFAGAVSHTVPGRTLAWLRASRMHGVERDIEFGRFVVSGRPPSNVLARMRHHGIVGLSIAVIDNYEVDWAAGYGFADRESRSVITPETLFQPGSISKSLNALGVLHLAQAHRVNLDDDVNTSLRTWRLPDERRFRGGRISLRAILSHTGGLNVHGFAGYLSGDALPTTSQILDGSPPANSEAVRAIGPSGERFRYSGGGTMISQKVVEDLTHVPYDVWMRDSILAPLGMRRSVYSQPLPAHLTKDAATGYIDATQEVKGKWPILPEQAAAGLWTTPSDLAQFVIAVQKALRGQESPLVSRALATAMTTPVLKGSPGLGTFVETHGGHTYFGHEAGNPGYMGKYLASAEGGKGVVVFVTGGPTPDILNEVVATVAREYRWPGFDAERADRQELTAIPLPNDSARRFAGAYRAGNYVTVFAMQPDGLVLLRPLGSQHHVHFSTPVDFFLEEADDTGRFLLDSGRVVGMATLRDGKEIRRATRLPRFATSQALLADIAGAYVDPDSTQVQIERTGTKAQLTVDGISRTIEFISPERFYTVDDYGMTFVVERDANGRVVGLIAEGDRRHMRIKRVRGA